MRRRPIISYTPPDEYITKPFSVTDRINGRLEVIGRFDTLKDAYTAYPNALFGHSVEVLLGLAKEVSNA